MRQGAEETEINGRSGGQQIFLAGRRTSFLPIEHRWRSLAHRGRARLECKSQQSEHCLQTKGSVKKLPAEEHRRRAVLIIIILFLLHHHHSPPSTWTFRNAWCTPTYRIRSEGKAYTTSSVAASYCRFASKRARGTTRKRTRSSLSYCVAPRAAAAAVHGTGYLCRWRGPSNNTRTGYSEW